MGRVLVEREFDDRASEALAADIDFECVAGRSVIGGHVAGANGDPAARRARATAHVATCRAIDEHRIAVTREGAIGDREAHELLRDSGRLLCFECRLPDKVTLLHLHEPLEIGFQRRDGVVDVVAVEGHPHLEAERVAAAESGGGDVAVLHEGVPDVGGVGDIEVELKAIFARVAGARDDHGALAGDHPLLEVVVLDGVEVDVGEFLENLLRLGALEGEQGNAIGDVFELRVELGEVLRDVGEVFVFVGRVDDHHEVVGGAVHEAVVFERAAIVEDARVVHLSDGERSDVVGGDVVDELQCLRAGDEELAHVAHVEQAAAGAHGVVFGGDSGGVLDRHFVAGEGDDLGTQGNVDVVERGALERSGCGNDVGHWGGLACFVFGRARAP